MSQPQQTQRYIHPAGVDWSEGPNMTAMPQQPPEAATEALLRERGEIYGDFTRIAVMAQDLKAVIHVKRSHLASVELEALDMIATKIARICCGERNKDHWDDIAGYAKLGGGWTSQK